MYNRQGCADCCPCSKSWVISPTRLVRFGQPMLRRKRKVDARDATTILLHRHHPRLRQATIGTQVQGYGAAGRYLSLFLEISTGAAVNRMTRLTYIRSGCSANSSPFLRTNLICCCYYAAPNCSFKEQTSTSTICPGIILCFNPAHVYLCHSSGKILDPRSVVGPMILAVIRMHYIDRAMGRLVSIVPLNLPFLRAFYPCILAERYFRIGLSNSPYEYSCQIHHPSSG